MTFHRDKNLLRYGSWLTKGSSHILPKKHVDCRREGQLHLRIDPWWGLPLQLCWGFTSDNVLGLLDAFYKWTKATFQDSKCWGVAYIIKCEPGVRDFIHSADSVPVLSPTEKAASSPASTRNPATPDLLWLFVLLKVCGVMAGESPSESLFPCLCA